jgi:hypothetical protein
MSQARPGNVHACSVGSRNSGARNRIAQSDKRQFIVTQPKRHRGLFDGGQTDRVGIPLNDVVFIQADHVLARLKAPFMVAGEMQPADTGVSIDLTAGDVSLAGRNWWKSCHPPACLRRARQGHRFRSARPWWIS